MFDGLLGLAFGSHGKLLQAAGGTSEGDKRVCWDSCMGAPKVSRERREGNSSVPGNAACSAAALLAAVRMQAALLLAACNSCCSGVRCRAWLSARRRMGSQGKWVREVGNREREQSSSCCAQQRCSQSNRDPWGRLGKEGEDGN
jgi:hypothetical protein